ncbi:ATP-dependent helicase HrpB [Deinococcus cellulosilyticus]|uniref:ATP-dependent helicase HrpB n=1 Tax=Deinococcus cellulosilyticus (strain DSM 18568 / NBRC 106333 / KACC 11606 / 5516J-15) TaxID=1223518 RepID=A0A511MVP1_DEIC1|nr:ATP-dependent helicase HrpB [Deinococcus cellulosilyticus]GEM44644.1 ATP-dependent helicase HrpB [Deinococcus cellulosilyticus NBRC 106333 = KACC 11606]
MSPQESLPISDLIPDLKLTLQKTSTAIVEAPPGAGKSTVLPLELLNESWLEGQKILMLQPRRLAAKAVAARMADLLGEKVGQTVGYRVRFETQVSSVTRIEVVTEGILTRILQSDPELSGIGLIIFDEFHERSLQADLALALSREVQQVLREDLKLLIMSATLDGEGLSRLLDDAPVLTSAGRSYPVAVRYLPRDLDGPLPALTAGVVSRALDEESGDVLAFLPGSWEIQRTLFILQERHPQLSLHALYGELPQAEQQAALLPDPQGRRKVVLATTIAETSLTIEGIRVVIDSGYTRIPRFDPRTGLSRLETVRVTLDAAIQRAGRAGRLGPGVCYRMWSEVTQNQLQASRPPEIMEADLAPLVLDLAQWGVKDPAALSWLTLPPTAALRQARDVLENLRAISGGTITPRGKSLLKYPTHPRLAHLLMEGEAAGQGALAADVAALLEERDPLPRDTGSDLYMRVEALRRWRAKQGTEGDVAALKRTERLAQQWRRLLKVPEENTRPTHEQLGLMLAWAYPERVAKLREGEHLRYRLANGRGVRLKEHDPLQGEPWLAVAHLDSGTDEGRIFLASILNIFELKADFREVETVSWDSRSGTLVARKDTRYLELVVESTRISHIPEEQRIQVLCQALRSEGLHLLSWNETSLQWQARVQSLHLWRTSEGWPDVSDQALLDTLDSWLGPFLQNVRKRDDFQKLDLPSILTGLLPWDLASRLDDLAPPRLEVPSGFKVQLQYFKDGSTPVLAVKLQEMFGLLDTPKVNGGRTPVLLHLLSPARRPVQVTQDLRSFWQNTYPEVRKELRVRYPKHPWPEDPWTATATRGVKRRDP